MGVAFKLTAKPLNAAAIKPQVEKLIEIKFDSHKVAAIKSPVENVANKTELLEKAAMSIKLIQNKEIVTDEEMVGELGFYYIPLWYQLTY